MALDLAFWLSLNSSSFTLLLFSIQIETYILSIQDEKVERQLRKIHCDFSLWSCFFLDFFFLFLAFLSLLLPFCVFSVGCFPVEPIFFIFAPLDCGLFYHNDRTPSFGIGLLSLVVTSLSSDRPFLGVYGTRMPLGRRCLRGVCSLKSPGDILVEVGAFQCDFL